MDDHTAQLLMELLTLGNQELDPEQAAAVERQLRALPDLEMLSQHDREFDALIRPAMRDVPIPTGLMDRIHTKLASQRGGVQRRRALRWSGGAFALVIGVVAVWGLRWEARPVLDAEEFASFYDERMRDPFAHIQPWLADHHVRFDPSLTFDPSLLTAFEMVEFQGERVPMLVFTNFRENVTARVYIVRNRQFHLKAITEEARQSFCSVQILSDREEPDRVGYVVLYTGGSITPFLLREASPIA